jgi:hypothetical protein
MQAISTIETASAKRYLGQFAKHFAHKLPVELAEDSSSAVVKFSGGACRMKADAARLRLELDAPLAAMDTLKDVVAHHLVRFAFREELTVVWRHVVV